MTAGLRDDVRAAWLAGVAAVRPDDCVRRGLEARAEAIDSRTLVVAVGKAAAGMLRGARQHAGDGARDARWIVLLPSGAPAGELPADVTLLRGGHPHPTSESFASTLAILDAVDGLEQGDKLLFLLSGGASALFEYPVFGLGDEDLVRTNEALVASGLPIASINAVRGCLSAVKAGGLAARALPASVVTLAISDVEGDDPATIGSGPTVASALSLRDRCAHALEILASSKVILPGAVEQRLREAAHSGATDAASARSDDFTVVASISAARLAASSELRARGYDVTMDDAYRKGTTSEAVATVLAEIARTQQGPAKRALVFGGETTVKLTRRPTGRGGRNLDLAARLAVALEGRDGVVVLAGGTDGIDGTSRAAGAVIDGSTAAKARSAGAALPEAIASFDTERGLEAAGALLVTGSTGTNVGDLTIVASHSR